MTPIRILVLGTGGMAKNHVAAFNAIPDNGYLYIPMLDHEPLRNLLKEFAPLLHRVQS